MAKYMLIMRGTDESVAKMMETPFEQMLETVGRFNEEMIRAGVLVAAEGLDDPAQGVVVDFSGETPVVTDGPYGETKELFGGFYVIDVASKEEAVEWAKRLPAIAGIEVRDPPGAGHRRVPAGQRVDHQGAGVARADRPALMAADADGPPSAESARRAVEAVWRIESARIVGALARYTGDFELAEDVAQEALAEALVTWSRDGAPANPVGWLLADRAGGGRSTTSAAGRRSTSGTPCSPASSPRVRRARARGRAGRSDDLPWDPDRVDDDVLALMFVACHPVLSPEARVALTLRAVGGLASEEIARAFLVPVPTVQARITRAKKTIAAAGVPFELPPAEERRERLGGVLSVLYVIFTEGSTATAGDRLLRPDLAYEAIRLARMLAALLPDEPEVYGLLALCELTAARFPARTGPTARRCCWRIRTGACGTGRRSVAAWPRSAGPRPSGAAWGRTGCRRRSPPATLGALGGADRLGAGRAALRGAGPGGAVARRRAQPGGRRRDGERAAAGAGHRGRTGRLRPPVGVVPAPERARRTARPARPDRRGPGRAGTRRPVVPQRPRAVGAAAQGCRAAIIGGRESPTRQLVGFVCPSVGDRRAGVVPGAWSDVGGGEVEPTGAVECVCGGARGAAGGQQGVLVAVAAGVVEGEAPSADGAGVAQPYQLDPFAVGELGFHVGEGAAVADVQLLQLRPGGAGVLVEALPPARAGCVPKAWAWRPSCPTDRGPDAAGFGLS